jgi:hypothetical protein
MFFFEKKNQKTFAPMVPLVTQRCDTTAATAQSLFASFSSEKEDS